jgi:hypothetical protein
MRNVAKDLPYVADTPAADLDLAGITAVEVANAEPDAVLIHPETAQDMLTVKAAGSGEYLSIDGPFGSAPTSLWGLPASDLRLVRGATASR